MVTSTFGDLSLHELVAYANTGLFVRKYLEAKRGNFFMGKVDILEQLDTAGVNAGIFFPRPDPGLPPRPGSDDVDIEVEPGIQVAARFHLADPSQPTILHFHGNGEIVADYDALVPAFHRIGASLVCADYRGYGRSTGQPSVRALVSDAHPVLDATLVGLRERGHNEPLVVMGRSLGSAPAIELASARPSDVAGLIVESGFARTVALLEHLGINVSALHLGNLDGTDNEDKMAQVEQPLLLLHAEQDIIVPPWHAQRNFARAASGRKRMVMIPNVDHNSILAFGGHRYWDAIVEFLRTFAACG